MNHGFFRAAAIIPAVSVADCQSNAASIIDLAERAVGRGAALVVSPEMSVSGYTCGDLFHNFTLLDGINTALKKILEWSETKDVLLVVGAPLAKDGVLYNCAIFIARGKAIAAIPKTYLPNYNEFYEKRWWVSGKSAKGTINIAGQADVPFGTDILVECDGVLVGAEICEDLWTPLPPSTKAAMAGAQIIVNLSASNDLIGKYAYLRSLVAQQSARCLAAYVYASAGYGESTTDLVFDGKCLIYENGTCLAASPRWEKEPHIAEADIDVEALKRDRMHIGSFHDCATDHIDAPYRVVKSGVHANSNTDLIRTISTRPFVPADSDDLVKRAGEIIHIQTAGLARRLDATHTRKLVVGISGGLDSTLALLVAVEAFRSLGLDPKGIIGITMPGFGTTGRTHSNAVTLMEKLGVTIREIPIGEAVSLHFRDIGHDPEVKDVTYENCQARERTQILMDVANQEGGMVLGTGDLSELALGWATYNGDQMSMYGVNAGVPKTLVKYLVHYFAVSNPEVTEVLTDIIDTPISPELIPADSNDRITQKTEDLVGPYELHDFFLYYTLRFGFTPDRIFFLASHAFEGMYDEDVIRKWLKTFCRRFFSQQFKRSCMPDGPKVGSICLSPRGDWRMPSDASSALWLEDI